MTLGRDRLCKDALYGKSNKTEADIKAALNAPVGVSSQTIGAANVRTKIRHFDLYITDGFINTASGAWPAPADNTVIAGWTQNTPATPAPNYAGPVYVWGFTDVDPNISGNLMTVPNGAYTEPANDIIGKEVGNAKFPSPFMECFMGEHVFITVHNRGFFQRFQQQDVGAVQDDHTLHLHGIHAQTPYDGFPESAGTYIEQSQVLLAGALVYEPGQYGPAADDDYQTTGQLVELPHSETTTELAEE